VAIDVFLGGWQIECCTPPPGEGDVVSWRLQWVDDPAGPGAHGARWRAVPAAPPAADGLVLHDGAVHAWWGGSAGDLPLRGRLLADDHGQVPEQVPPVTGTVLSVRVVEQAYLRTGMRTYEPLAGAYSLRPVPRSPRWFTSDRPDPPPEVLREESGVLLGLRIDLELVSR
jgi:hypothetical protein